MLGLCTFGSRLHRHYLIFLEANQKFWSGVVPYGLDYDSSGIYSHYFYSPSSALVFGPFIKFSPHVGNFLYMGISLVLFFWGLSKLMKALGVQSQKGLGLFYLALSSEIVGSTFGSKIEVITMALLFFVYTWIIEERKLFWAGVLFAWAFSWKLQPAPMVGLLFLFFLRFRLAKEFFLGFILSLFVGWAYPFVVFPTPYAVALFQAWSKDLNFALNTVWGEFTTAYTVSRHIWGWPTDYAGVQKMGAVVGALIGSVFGLYCLFCKKRKQAFDLALVLGSAYIVVFSPMSQGMAYILGTPTVLLSCLMLQKEEKFFSNAVWRVAIFAHWWVSSLNFSDLAFPAIRIESFPIRPFGFVLLAALYLIESIYAESKRVSVSRNPLPFTN